MKNRAKTKITVHDAEPSIDRAGNTVWIKCEMEEGSVDKIIFFINKANLKRLIEEGKEAMFDMEIEQARKEAKNEPIS